MASWREDNFVDSQTFHDHTYVIVVVERALSTTTLSKVWSWKVPFPRPNVKVW